MAADPGMRRRDKRIDETSELERILDEAQVLHLGLVDDGLPYVVPLNFAREGDVLWFHCAGEGRKLRCLRASPRVCVEVERLIEVTSGPAACADWTSHYESVIGFGTAVEVGDEAERTRGLQAIMRKYSGRDGWEFSAADLARTTVVRVTLESLSGKRSPASR